MAVEPNTIQKTCAQCGSLFPDVIGRRGRPRQFCSKPCLFTARSRRNGAKPLAIEHALRKAAAKSAVCPECRTEFRANRNSRLHRYCSRDCLHAPARRAALVRAEARIYARWARRAADAGKPEIGRICPGCGHVRLVKHEQRCQPCAKVRGEERRIKARSAYKLTDTYQRIRRAAKAKRRAVERGIAAERFDPFEIFNRDGWRCHICGVKTPKRLRGTFEDNAPELDHIIPLAAGGEHSRRNTACSCRKCNRIKGATPLGQMRLVA
jgi:5-methylcytosine-specific restriction endonuclease McrA